MPQVHQLLQKQSLPLESKIRLAMMRVRAWYANTYDEITVVDDGSEQSRVLVHLVHDVDPDVPAVSSVQKFSIVPFMVETDPSKMENWLQHGCNAHKADLPTCRPLSTWMPEDIQKYTAQILSK